MVSISNNSVINISDIPVVNYGKFYMQVDSLLLQNHNHCINYFAVPQQNGTFINICCIANDIEHTIYILAHTESKNLEAISAKHYAMHVFEREMHENYGITFNNHPWLKPLRYPVNRYNHENIIKNYPFYSIESDELHEVGVGPIHAGVIEPGHFRFICNGEKVLHLEIMMGYQHRGIETLMLNSHQLKRAILAESIAGDTAIGHSLAYANVMEGLSGTSVNNCLQLERTIALELERIAIHIGDTGALCMDIAYQLGQVVCEALRAIIINTTQAWCGNRFGKGFIRPAGSHYPLTAEKVELILKNLDEVENRYKHITDLMFNLPSVLSRFEDVGIVTNLQAQLTGLTGMAARMAGVNRDIRTSHPFGYYKNISFESVIHTTGDVLARAMLRRDEVMQSIKLVYNLLDTHKALQNKTINKPNYEINIHANSLCVSLTEGWRGEICHIALTNDSGEIYFYKIKDPSLHNWMGLALAVRNQEISDFPICNKSFNLSYCGHDL